MHVSWYISTYYCFPIYFRCLLKAVYCFGMRSWGIRGQKWQKSRKLTKRAIFGQKRVKKGHSEGLAGRWNRDPYVCPLFLHCFMNTPDYFDHSEHPWHHCRVGVVNLSQGVRLRHGPHVTNWDIEECVSLSKRYEIWCLKHVFWVKTHPRQCYRVKNYFFKLNLWENAGQNPPQGWALYMVVSLVFFFLRKLFSWDPRISSSKTAVFLICYVRAIFWSGKVIFWSKVDEK